MFTFDFVSIFAAISSIGASYVLHKFSWFENYFVKQVLQLCMIVPRSSNCEEILSSKPLYLFACDPKLDLGDPTILYKELRQNLHIGGAETVERVVQVIEGILASPLDFYLYSIDGIIISQMGFEILIMKFPPQKYDRCIIIDMTTYRNTYLQFHMYLTGAIGVISLLIVANKDIRNLAHLCTQFICK